MFTSEPSPSPGIDWINNVMGECIFTKFEQFGFALGLLSTIIWMYAQIPQLILNCRQKGVSGLSGGFLTLLVCGDLMNLSGVIFTNGLATQIITAVWFTFVDGSVWVQWVYYVHIKPRCDGSTDDQADFAGQHPPAFAVMPLLIGAAYSSSVDPYDKAHLLGSILGWGSAACYISSRCPQIYTNYKRKKTEGLSIQYFLSALFGNTTYAASIFLKDASWPYIWLQFPWLLGSLGILFFDGTVLIQFHLYNREDLIAVEAVDPQPLVPKERGHLLDSIMD
jgi:uncharacterized protein with PQ loop repeat